MFTNSLVERDASCIHIHDVDADVMKHVIEFIYIGETQVTNENAQYLMTAGAMFDLPHLIGLCTDHVIREICISNCVELFSFSSHFVCKRLRENVKQYILDHFMEVITDANDKLVELDIDHLDEMMSADDLCIDNEEVLFEELVKWTSFEETRPCYFPKLFKHIRISLVAEEYINETIRKHTYVIGDPICQQILRRYDRYKAKHSPAEHNHVYTEINTTPRHGMFNRTMMVFSGGASSKSDRALTVFDPVTCKNYIGVQPHPTFDLDHKIDHYQLVTVSNSRLYFIGGVYYEEYRTNDSVSALSEVYQYNIKCVKWEQVANMQTPRCCFAAAVIGSRIYVIGGKPHFPRLVPTGTVEVYDADEDFWSEVSPVPISIYAHSAAVTSQNDAIYVFGGKDEYDEVLDTVFRYTVLRDAWTLVTTQMPKPRAFCSTFSYNDAFYIIGGSATREHISTVSMYHPSNNTWEHGKEFPEQRKITAAGYHDGSIFICGGVRQLGVSGRRSREVESRDLYKYAIENDTWTKVVRLVQYGNTASMTMAVLNTKYLCESDFVSSI